MSERKSINKYYGDSKVQKEFEAFSKNKSQRNKLARALKGNDGNTKLSQDVRLMAPFSMICLNCNEYISKSRKFNAKKETLNEKYLGIKIYRFSIRCSGCSNKISYRTDPKTADYIIESGAQRNYVSGTNNHDSFSTDAENLKGESLEETLNRLEKEEKEAKEEELKREKKIKLQRMGIDENTDDLEDKDVMEKLESRLQKIEEEEQSKQEIEELWLSSSRNKKKERQLTNNNILTNSMDTGKNDDDLLAAIAKRAFLNKKKTSAEKDLENEKLNLISNAKVTKISKKKRRKIII